MGDGEPGRGVDLPPIGGDTEVHYLTVHEVEALASAAVDGEHQALDRALYVMAAMTGLRQGELIALRWSERLDWTPRESGCGAPMYSASSTRPRAAGASAGVSRALVSPASWTCGSRRPAGSSDDARCLLAQPATGDGASPRGTDASLSASIEGGEAGRGMHRFHDPTPHVRDGNGRDHRGAMRMLQEWMGHQRPGRRAQSGLGLRPECGRGRDGQRAFADPLADAELPVLSRR